MSLLHKVNRRVAAIATVVAVATAVLLVVALTVPRTADAKPRRDDTGGHGAGNPGWVATWAASPLSGATTSFADQTVRNVIYTSVGGSQARIRLSNRYGTQPVTIDATTVGEVLNGAHLLPGSTRAATFAGRTSVTIPVGGEVVSDPVRMQVSALTELAVDVYLPAPTGPANYHALAWQTNYVAAGDHAGDVAGDPFTTKVSSWYYVDGVDVRNPPTPGTVVAFGDSITDVGHTQVDAEARWPNYLARRLTAAYGKKAPAVVDAGISANRVLHDTAGGGASALTRFQRDALDQPGVRAVILLEGINDIGRTDPTATAAEIEAGYLRLVRAAHAAGVKIYVGTLTPFSGANCVYHNNYGTAAGEAERVRVNRWIRSSHAFDGVVDFDTVTANPKAPEYFRPSYNATGGATCSVGDSLHPNDLGSEAMADAIPLAWFTR
ncbi:SGNH/GDSL hydrolase family protein [Actinocatenispora rupis]|uniref:SGNH/GDSL hydrolase family protein n=1 Tax=Actinocatenispora rupis TaxID=519421 RepID=UPI001EF17897|nr:SGNH/GDSL hydrolase family protein [Actinocatenispora rupis]